MVRGKVSTDVGNTCATNVPGRDENSLDASRHNKNKTVRARKGASSKTQKPNSRKPLREINENSLEGTRDVSTKVEGVLQQGSESSNRTLVSTPPRFSGAAIEHESSTREEQTEESLQEWLQRSYPDVTANSNMHPAISELWDETVRLRNLVDKVKDAELELAAQEAEEASKRELELESMLNVQWGRRVAFAEAATAGASRLAEHHQRTACQAEQERDAARAQLGRAEEYAQHLAAKLKDQSDHLERLRADYSRTSAALQKQKEAVDAGRGREEAGHRRLKEVEAQLAAYLARRSQERDEAEAAQVQAMNEIEQLTADKELLQTEAELQRLEAAQATAALKAANAETSITSQQDASLICSLQNEIHKLNAALLANAKGTVIDDEEEVMQNDTLQEVQRQLALLQASYAEALRMDKNLSDGPPETTSEVLSTNQATDLKGMLEAAQLEVERFSAAHAEAAAEAEQLGALYMSAIEEQETLKANHEEEICELNRRLEVLYSQAAESATVHSSSSAEIERLSSLYIAAMAEIDELKRVACERASADAQRNAGTSDDKDTDSMQEVMEAATELLMAGMRVERANGDDLVEAPRGDVVASDAETFKPVSAVDQGMASTTHPPAPALAAASDDSESLAASAGMPEVTASHERALEHLEQPTAAMSWQSAERVEAVSAALAGAEEEGAPLARARSDEVAEVEWLEAAAGKELDELRVTHDEATRGRGARVEAERVCEHTQIVEAMKLEGADLAAAHALASLEIERLMREAEETHVTHELVIQQMQERMCMVESQTSPRAQYLVSNMTVQACKTGSFEAERTCATPEKEVGGIYVHLGATQKNVSRLEVVEKESSGKITSLMETVLGLREELARLQGEHAVASAEVERLREVNLATFAEMEGLQNSHEEAIQTLQEELRDAWSQGVDHVGEQNVAVVAMKSDNAALWQEMAKVRSAHDAELVQMQGRLEAAAGQHMAQVEELESAPAEVERMTDLVSSALEAAAHREAVQEEQARELSLEVEAAAEEREALCIAHAEALRAMQAPGQAAGGEGTPPPLTPGDVSTPQMDSDLPAMSTPAAMSALGSANRDSSVCGSLQYCERYSCALSQCTRLECNAPASLLGDDVRWRYNAVYSETKTGSVPNTELARTSPVTCDLNAHDTCLRFEEPANVLLGANSELAGESDHFGHKEADLLQVQGQELSSPKCSHTKRIQELTDTVSNLRAEIQRLEGAASESERAAERYRAAEEENQLLTAVHQDEVQRLQRMLDMSSMPQGSEEKADSSNMQTTMQGEVERLTAALADTTADLQRLAVLNTDTRVEMEQLKASHARALQRRQDELDAAQSQMEMYLQETRGAALEADVRALTEVDNASVMEAARTRALYDSLVEEQHKLKASHQETVQELQRQLEAMGSQSAEHPNDLGVATAPDLESGPSSEACEMKGLLPLHGHHSADRIQELTSTVVLLEKEVANLQAAKTEATQESERMCELYLAALEEQERIKTTHEQAWNSQAVQEKASATLESQQVDELTSALERMKCEVERLETALATATAESERLSALYMETMEELEVTREQAVQLLQDHLEEVAVVEETEQTERDNPAEEHSACNTELVAQSAGDALGLAEKVTILQEKVHRLLSENKDAAAEARHLSEMYLAAVDEQDCLKAAHADAIQRLQHALDGSKLYGTPDQGVKANSSEVLAHSEIEALSAVVASTVLEMQRLVVSNNKAKLEMQQLKASHECMVLRMEEELRAAQVRNEQQRQSVATFHNSETRRLQAAHADAAADAEKLSAMYREVVEELDGLKSTHTNTVQELQRQLNNRQCQDLEQVNNLVDTVRAMRVQIDTLTIVYEDATEHIERLTLLNDSVVKEMSQMKASHEQAIDSANEQMELSGSQLLLQVTELTAKMAAMKAEINRLESAHADTTADSQEFAALYQAAVQETEHISESYGAALHSMRKQLQVTKDDFSNQIGELYDTASCIQKETRRLEQKHAEAAADSERLSKLHQSTVVELDAVRTAHEQSSCAMQQQLEAAGTKHMLELEGLASAVGTLMALTDRLETANAEAEVEARGLRVSAEEDVQSLLSTVQALRAEIGCLKAEKKVAKAAVVDAERVSGMYLAAVEELEALKTAHEEINRNSQQQQQQQRMNMNNALSNTFEAQGPPTNMPVTETATVNRVAEEAAQQEMSEVAGVLASAETTQQQSNEGAVAADAIGRVDMEHSDSEAIEAAQLKAQIAEARVAAAHVRKVQSEARAQMQNMQAAEEAEEMRYQDLRVRHGLATQELEQLRTASAASCEYVMKLESANSALATELSRLKSVHAEVAEEAGIWKVSASRSNDEICRLGSLLESSSDSRTKIAELQAELDRAGNRIARLEYEMHDASMTAAAEIEALQAQSAYSEMEVENLKASAEYSRREMQCLESRNALVEQERERWRRDHNRLLAELGRMQESVSSLAPTQPVNNQAQAPADPVPQNTGACSTNPAIFMDHTVAFDGPAETTGKTAISDKEATHGGVRNTVGCFEEVAKLAKENALLMQQVAQLQSTKASLSEEKRKHAAAKRRAEGHVAKLKDFNEKAIQEIQLLNTELKDSRMFQEAAAKQANDDFKLLREQIDLHVQWVQTKHLAVQVSPHSALEEDSIPVGTDPDTETLPTSATACATLLKAELELSKTQVETLQARQAALEGEITSLTMNNKSLVEEVLGLKEEARRLQVPIGCAEDVCSTKVASDSNDKGKVCEVQVELLSSLMDKQLEAHQAGVARAAAEEQRLRTEAQRQIRELQAAEADAEFLRAALEQQARVKAAMEKEADAERRRLKAQLGQQALEAEAAMRLVAQRQRAAEQQAAVDRSHADLLRSQIRELQAALESQTSVKYHQDIPTSHVINQSSMQPKSHTATPTPFQRSCLRTNSSLEVDPSDPSCEEAGGPNEEYATPNGESRMYSFGLDQALSFTGMNSLLRMTPNLSTDQFLASLSPFSNVFNSSISHSPTPGSDNKETMQSAFHLASPFGIGAHNSDAVSMTSPAELHRNASTAECTPQVVDEVVTVLAGHPCVTTPLSGGYGLTRPTPRMRSRMRLRTGRSMHSDGNTDTTELNEQENPRACILRKPYDSELSRKLKAMNMRLTPVLGYRPKSSKDD